jgi:hypothetical protein
MTQSYVILSVYWNLDLDLVELLDEDGEMRSEEGMRFQFH